ncbi:hypothetical protein MN608_06491 [Microdochium nivale]|nr:hypothetical protein MN608_06491 [Microdochium nivale]
MSGFSSHGYFTSTHDKRQKHAKPIKHSSKSRTTTVESEHIGLVDFVFAVIELEVTDAYFQEQRFDDWGNSIPPFMPEHFNELWNSHVYRYRDGDVFEAPNYIWSRQVESEAAEVRIFRLFPDPSTSVISPRECTPCHDGRTLFNCGPFLPAVIADCDVVNIETFSSQWELQRAIENNPGLATQRLANVWRSLRLHKDNVVTRVSTLEAYPKHVAPQASWVPSIVPEQYRDPDPRHQGSSHGLGGDFGTIIGLMALGQAPHQTREAFASAWRGYQWAARRQRDSFTGVPRGILVHMAIDDSRQEVGQALMAIHEAELYDTIIYDSTPAASTQSRHPHK